MTGTRLDPILDAVRARAAERRKRHDEAALRAALDPAHDGRGRFVDAVRGDGLRIIAECKRRSPSEGALKSGADLDAQARDYREGGAAALSILTEQDHFGGSLADFDALAEVGLPRLRKDFVLDEWMLLESAAHRADCVLLLAVCLPDPLLGELRAAAAELGMAVLLEVHDAEELERALAWDPDLLGINARDLRSFEVRLDHVLELLPRVPDEIGKVAESGLARLEDLRAVATAGADAALVGSALMRAADPRAMLRSWTAALGTPPSSAARASDSLPS